MREETDKIIQIQAKRNRNDFMGVGLDSSAPAGKVGVHGYVGDCRAVLYEPFGWFAGY